MESAEPETSFPSGSLMPKLGNYPSSVASIKEDNT